MIYPKMTISILTLVLANLFPLVGVLFFGWDAGTIVLLYWTENVVVGFYIMLRILFSTGATIWDIIGKIIATLLFWIHFGGFCGVHGVFLLSGFQLGQGNVVPPFTNEEFWPFPFIALQILINVIYTLWHCRPSGMELPLIGLFMSHGVSFIQNFKKDRDDAGKDVVKIMVKPYKRITILQVTILAGAILINHFNSPVVLVVILVGLKVYMDIRFHSKAEVVEPSIL